MKMTPTKRPPQAPNVRVTLVLDCGHTVIFRQAYAPKILREKDGIGEEVWCRRCEDYRECLTSLRGSQWSCRDCRASRTHGQDHLACRMSAVRHYRKMHHTVDVWQKGEHMFTLAPGADPTFDDLPPF